MRLGVRIGVDVGTVRVGIARSDRDGLLATPLETLSRDDQTLARVIELVRELDCMECCIGLPLSLSGTHTPSTENAVTFARELSTALSIPVRLIDERLTTVSAHAALKQSGKQASRSRSVVDQVAAVMLLQHALDTERALGDAPGISVDDYK